MRRRWGVLNLAQGGVYVAFALYHQDRWLGATAILLVAAVAQWVAGGLLLARGDERGLNPGNWVSLLGVGVVFGLYLQVGVHIAETFTPVGAKTGYALMGAAAAALPWVIFFPIAQLIATWRSRAGLAGGALLLAGILFPPGIHAAALSPESTYPSHDGAPAAQWLRASWLGEDVGPPPDGPGPVVAVVTVVHEGALLESATTSGDSLADVLQRAVPSLPPLQEAGLVLELATAEGPLRLPVIAPRGPIPLRPGRTGLRHDEGIHSTLSTWREPAVAYSRMLEGPSVPGVKLSELDGTETAWVDLDGWMTSDHGTVTLEMTWAEAPALDAEAALEAALAGGRHIAHNQNEAGRYAYVVRGPTGIHGGGYNYPRHAGATWFLARLYVRTQDPEIGAAAERGIAYLIEHSKLTEDGRAHIHDPARKDGKAWVGTTALALLALTEMGVEPEWQDRYARFVASAVDERGSVRGDMTVATGEWPVQDEVTYAQGQGLLGLVAAERAGIDVSDALDRAIAYVDGGYWPIPAANLGTLDEHWMCLASAAVGEQRTEAAGVEVCTAYLRGVAVMAPVPGSGIQPASGPAAGLAEAVVARAELDRRAGVEGPYHQRSLDYGQLLLDTIYQEEDTPLLGRSDNLIGGFRDRPWALDVRVDAVQHIGCALLGVEQLLREEVLPGAMP
ncbi:MAG TPA: hypothetical protein QGF58_22085 [Myxococcota bacterium]|nr:hypothetical protein [Myxococcota bacterium]